MKESCLSRIDNMIKRYELLIEIERRHKVFENGPSCTEELKSIVRDLKEIKRMVEKM